MKGDTTETSVIWVPGEESGRNPGGANTVRVPHGDITVSGGIPAGTPGVPTFHFNKLTAKLHVWDGASWYPVSGA